MFAAVAVAALLTAPPDPLDGLKRFAENATFVSVLHPAAVWQTPMCATLRENYAAVDLSKPPTDEKNIDASLAHGLAQVFQPLGVKSPADVVRLAYGGGIGSIQGLVTLRTPLDPKMVERELPKLFSLPDHFRDAVTVGSRNGVPTFQVDCTWTAVALLDGGRTAVLGPPPFVDAVVRSAGDPAPIRRLLEQVRAGKHLCYYGNGQSSFQTMFTDWLAGTGVACDGLTAFTGSLRFTDRTTVEVWLDGCKPPADPAAALKLVSAKYSPMLREAIPVKGDDPFMAAALPFVRAAADGFEKLEPLPAGDSFAARMVVPGTPPPMLLSAFPGPMILNMVCAEFPTTENPQLQAVTKALLAYQAKHGTLPPACTRDAAGKPLLSWRVAILPFLGEKAAVLYPRFRQTEPWDSDHNLNLIDEMPDVFRPWAYKFGEPLTAFQVFIGPGTAYEGGVGRATKEFADGPLTALVGEGDRLVPWTKPQDQTVEPDTPVVGRLAPNTNQLDGRIWLGLADGSVRAVATGSGLAPAGGPPLEELRRRLNALLTRAGGEKLASADVPSGQSIRRRPQMPEIVPAAAVEKK